jgi:predicted DNA-binding ribbon-helix-helix protein
MKSKRPKPQPAQPAKRGPKPGSRFRPDSLTLTRGRRVTVHLLTADYHRLVQAADARRMTIAGLVRDLLLSGLDSANGTTGTADAV